MKVVFRVDASTDIGTGHVMRCLTLAHALANKGAQCQFICRAHDGNLIDYIGIQGFQVHVLALGLNAENNLDGLEHSGWLGVSQIIDAEACIPILQAFSPEWLVIDHYAIDARWEAVLAPYCNKLMVIDDLADRPHMCDFLLDQTFGREAVEYLHHVPLGCTVLCGSKYALLRPEFSVLRNYSLERRKNQRLKRILISMGGIDKNNVTCQLLRALKDFNLPSDCYITIVMGDGAPWLHDVQRESQDLEWVTEVLVGIDNMAQVMADSDLAFGAAGSSAWERCCLGLPTIMFVLAKNQIKIAEQLSKIGATVVVPAEHLAQQYLKKLLNSLISNYDQMTDMTNIAKNLVDGRGAELTALKMMA